MMIARLLVFTMLVSLLCAGDPGRPAPAFNMLRVNQPPIRLSQYRGKVVVLAFILTTCGHCQQLTVELNRVAREYAARGVQVVECAFNGDAVLTMPDFLQRFEPPFPVTYSTPVAVSVFLHKSIFDPEPVRVPIVVLIDRAGNIQEEIPSENEFYQNPGRNLRVRLDQMLSK